MASSGRPELCLAPHAVLLRRSATELQIGIEPSVVVPQPYERLVRQLGEGSDRVTLEQTARTHGLPARAVPELVAALADARLLHPAASPPTAVRLVGAGPLGARTAHELVAAGCRTLYLADLPERSRDPTLNRTGGRGRRRRRRTGPEQPDRLDLLAASLEDVRTGVRVRRSRHFVHPEGDAVALTVVVADGPEPDRLVPDLLREAGAAHLLVRCRGDEAVVGPLVVPGRTSCVRCADLARRDADPCWPSLLDQLTRLALEPPATLLAWAGVTAAVQAAAFLDGHAAETLGRTLELGLQQHTLRLRTWPSHPECPCRWADATPALLPGLVPGLA